MTFDELYEEFLDNCASAQFLQDRYLKGYKIWHKGLVKRLCQRYAREVNADESKPDQV